jgi:hypothetical protein
MRHGLSVQQGPRPYRLISGADRLSCGCVSPDPRPVVSLYGLPEEVNKDRKIRMGRTFAKTGVAPALQSGGSL